MSKASGKKTVDHQPLLNDIILHENDLTAQAKSQFGYHNEILRAFELNRRSVLGNDKFTHVGRHLLLSMLSALHTTCKRVLNYAAENNELLRRNLPNNGPLIICGLPRTGSTLLYNLLACDPNCRAPLATDMLLGCVPPVSRSNMNEHQRRARTAKTVEKSREQLLGRSTTVTESHPSFPFEEDVIIFFQAGLSSTFMLMNSPHQCELDDWIYDKANKDFAYDYHETFLRILNSADMPRSHWLLKWSRHALYLDTLFRHYPQAAVIMTHRNLHDVLPSWCNMMWGLAGNYYEEGDSISRATVTKKALQYIDRLVERIMTFRTHSEYVHNQAHKPIFDLVYDDLMEYPIATVHCIYNHFGLRWSQQFEVAMYTWLHDNPQGKQGRHTYSLADFDLKQEDIETRYADYIHLFLRSSFAAQCSSGAISDQ